MNIRAFDRASQAFFTLAIAFAVTYLESSVATTFWRARRIFFLDPTRLVSREEGDVSYAQIHYGRDGSGVDRRLFTIATTPDDG